MFGKLVKYEMKSSMKIFALVWGAILVVALINGFSLRVDPSLNVEWSIIPILLYGMLVASIVAITAIFIVTRFYKGLLGDEGYLMFTLPTTTRSLIIAKSLSATIMVVLSAIVGILSMLLFFLPSAEWGVISKAFDEFLAFNRDQPMFIPCLIEACAVAILGAINFIYHIYASIAIGHLASKHRLAFSFVAYIGISIAINVLAVIGGYCGLDVYITGADFNAPASMAIVGAIEIIGIVIYHCVTEFILRKKLNLE